MELIDIVRETWGAAVEVIAGGGVDSIGAVQDYLARGANHVALGSVCFNWFKMKKILEK
jgi:dihydroorotate dehydrogenase